MAKVEPYRQLVQELLQTYSEIKATNQGNRILFINSLVSLIKTIRKRLNFSLSFFRSLPPKPTLSILTNSTLCDFPKEVRLKLHKEGLCYLPYLMHL